MKKIIFGICLTALPIITFAASENIFYYQIKKENVKIVDKIDNEIKSSFDENGINNITGTIYDPDGYDVNGFNESGINKETGTVYDPEGYDKNGLSSKECAFNSYTTSYSYTVGVSNPSYYAEWENLAISTSYTFGSSGQIRGEYFYSRGNRYSPSCQQYSTCFFYICRQKIKQ